MKELTMVDLSVYTNTNNGGWGIYVIYITTVWAVNIVLYYEGCD